MEIHDSLNVGMTTNKAKPVHEVRLGFIKAAVWRNETESGVRYNVTFSRLYKDGEQWKPVAAAQLTGFPVTVTPSNCFGVKRDQFNRVTFAPVTNMSPVSSS